MKTSISIVIATILALQCQAGLAAQMRDKQQGEQPPAASDPCEARPDAGQKGPGQQGTNDLTRCKGVLKPPANMDDSIQKKPTEEGEMPVIPPNQLPSQRQSK